MRPLKALSAMSLTILFTGAMSAQAEITPLVVPAGTAVICEPYAKLNTQTLQPASAAQSSVLPLSCGIADGNKAAKQRFQATLMGSYDTLSGRAVIAWKQLSFPSAVQANGVDLVTLEMNDRETFASREWFDGKLRVSFKRDLVFAQKN